jgi:hypothetical protein
MVLRPLHDSFAAVLAGGQTPARDQRACYREFLTQAAAFSAGRLDVDASLAAFDAERQPTQPAAATRQPVIRPAASAPPATTKPAATPTAPEPTAPEPAAAVLPVLRALRPLRASAAAGGSGRSGDNLRALSWISEWRLGPIIAAVLVSAGWDPRLATLSPALFSLALRLDTPASATWAEIVSDPAAEQFLMVNTFEGVRWFSKEALGLLIASMEEVWRSRGVTMPGHRAVLDAAEKTGYRWDVFLKLVAVTESRSKPE